jgi:hypothetical protein
MTNLSLPKYFWQIFCNEDYELPSSSASASALERNLLECSALAMRHGIISCIPETYLDLLTSSNLHMLLNQGGTLNVEILRISACYSSPLTEHDEVADVFWLALSDLTRQALLKFLQTLWATTTGGAEGGEEEEQESLPDGLCLLLSPPHRSLCLTSSPCPLYLPLISLRRALPLERLTSSNWSNTNRFVSS